MSKRKIKARRPKSDRRAGLESPDGRTADATTVAWTVSVTTVFLCDLAAVAAHFYARANPQIENAYLLSQLLLVSAAIVGLLSLILMPVVLRMRRSHVPSGFLAFAFCSAVAPILALLVQLMQRR
jgi:hypothetical protein